MDSERDGQARLVRAEIRDFERIEVVALEIGPRGVLQVAGPNGAGKSSVLDALAAALGGAKYAPSKPIRRGTKRSQVVVETDEYVIEQVWTEKSERLVVKLKEGGEPIGRPRERLDALLGPLAFDPVAFAGLPPAEQRAMLLDLVGIDFAPLDAEREAAYQRRRDLGRDLRAEQARLDGMPRIDLAAGEDPPVEVSVAEISTALSNAMAMQAEAEAAGRRREEAERELLATRAEIESLEQRLAKLRDLERTTRDAIADLTADHGDALAAVPDLDALRKRLAGAEEANRRARHWAARAELVARVAGLTSEVDSCTREIEAVDARKADLLAEAEMPIEGLAVDAEGLTYGGIPLEQASQAELIRVAVAITAALTPSQGLRLALVRQGNDLDEASKLVLQEEAIRLDLLVVLERIVPPEDGAFVVIEAGRVAEVSR